MLYRRLSSLFMLVCLFPVAVFAGVSEQDFSTIKRYGELANAAYGGKALSLTTCDKQGYKLDNYGTAKGVGVSYFLATDEASKTQIIAVRGTASAENVMVDADFQLKLDKHTGNYIHTGFAQSAMIIYQDIKSRLKRDYTIDTTGHSLGGAVALVLAMYLDQDDYRVGKVITFGQPKVTNITGAKRYESMKIIRVVTDKDMVPMVPPFDPVDVENIDIYWHAGEELILLPGGDYSITSGIPSMLRAVKFFQEVPSEQNLQYHMMSFYLELLDKKLSGGKQVPYKTGVTLFDMF